MYKQQEIKEKKVGLNFEDPADQSLVSTATFGEWDYNQVKNGQDGFVFIDNSAPS